jgi:hypothetical protein
MLGTVVSSCPHAITLLSTGSTITAPFAGCKIKEREGKVKCESEAHWWLTGPHMIPVRALRIKKFNRKVCECCLLTDSSYPIFLTNISCDGNVNIREWMTGDLVWHFIESKPSSKHRMHTTHLDVHIHHITRLSTKYHQNKWQHKYQLEIKHPSNKQATTTRKTNSNLKALLRPSE